MYSGIWRGSVTSIECLTTGSVIPVTSASWKPSVPIRSVRTWPVMNTVGTESIIASAIGVTRLVAPGPGGRQRHPDPARGLGVALGRMPGTLLVAGLDVGQVGVVERVVGGQVGATGDAEDVLDPLGLEGLEECVGRAHGGDCRRDAKWARNALRQVASVQPIDEHAEELAQALASIGLLGRVAELADAVAAGCR